MDNNTTEVIGKVAEINPQLFLQMSVVVFAVFIILIIVWGTYKFILPAIKDFEDKKNEPCIKDCFYKKDFAKNTEEIREIGIIINDTTNHLGTLVDKVADKVDVSARENRESFSQLIRMAEKQNDVLVELSTQAKLHTQMLINVRKE